MKRKTVKKNKSVSKLMKQTTDLNKYSMFAKLESEAFKSKEMKKWAKSLQLESDDLVMGLRATARLMYRITTDEMLRRETK